METKNNLTFEISGNDFNILKKFRKQHNNCVTGSAGDKFNYTFIPTGLGTAVSVECSCGQRLMLGDFMEYKTDEYKEEENRILTERDQTNIKFEEAVLCILQMKDPRLFRMGFQTEQGFEIIYSVSAVGIARFSDTRISRCILWKIKRGKEGELIDNYKGLDEKGKIRVFYDFFEEQVRRELQKYDCHNDTLLKALGVRRKI